MLYDPPYVVARDAAIQILTEGLGADVDVTAISYQNATVEEAREVGRRVNVRPQAMVSNGGVRTEEEDTTGRATVDGTFVEVLIAAKNARSVVEQVDLAEKVAYSVRKYLQGMEFRTGETIGVYRHVESMPVITSKDITLYAVTFNCEMRVDLDA